MTTARPIASVVIPAYNEAAVIDRCLDTLLTGDPRLFVVVAANGCSDDTAERARRHGVEVVDVPEASKVAALNAADDHCGDIFPRIYLDADVVLHGHDAEAVAAVLAPSAEPLVCAPRIEFDTTGASALVRAFYLVYSQLPYIRAGLVGSGCFAVNSTGRARWTSFPDIIADDLFVQGLFGASERQVVDSTTFRVTVPRSIRGLLRVRTRTYLGNRQADQLGAAGSMADGTTSSLRALRQLCRERPMLIGPAAVYLIVNSAAAVRARFRSGNREWLTDSTSRTSV